MTTNLQQEILTCIRSKDLKRHIEEHNCTFTPPELLSLVYRFAPTYDHGLRLLQLLAEQVPEVRELAEKCILFQEKALESCKTCQSDEVYELHILENPDAYEERYLCRSYDAALDMIDAFYREYDFARETEATRYTITKRQILNTPEAFGEDALGECTFGPGKVLLSADDWTAKDHPAQELVDVFFPDFVPDNAAVLCHLPDGSHRRGVCLYFGSHEATDDLYIIPFDCRMMVTGDFRQYWDTHCHEHIPAPYVEILSPEDLTEEELRSYEAFLEYRKNQ